MDEPSWGRCWPDWRAIALLTLIALGLRSWQLTHTEVASRDSISYIRIAWRLGHDNWLSVIPKASHHPGYPIAILGMSYLVRPFLLDDLPRTMQLSAQLASSLAGVLLVLPMYFLGRELFNRRVAFGATLLFQCLPSGGRVLGDGLSEGLFLLLAVSSLTVACQSIRTGSRFGFAFAGLCSALAYLTRPEGAGVALAAGLVLLGTQTITRWRRPWLRSLACGVCLTIGFLSVAGPFVALIGHVTVKNTGHMMLDKVVTGTPGEPDSPVPDSAGIPTDPLLWAVWNESLWDRNDSTSQSLYQRRLWATWAFGMEMWKGYFYVGWVPVLLGLFWFRDRFRVVPGALIVLLLCLIFAATLFHVATVGGYLSDRHLLVIILCSLYWGVAAIEVLGRKAAMLLARLRPALTNSRWASVEAWTLGLLLAFCTGPLIRTLEPLHADRAGFKEAGHWLAEHAGPEDAVEDPYTWARFYAGRFFLEEEPAAPQTWYIVLEESKNKHPHITKLNELEQRAKTGQVVRRWPVLRGRSAAEILIYAVRN